jgi:hypothetical protein
MPDSGTTQADSTRAAGDQAKGPPALRLLVVANETVKGRALREEVKRRVEGRPTSVMVVAPALVSSRLKHGFGDVDEAIETARRRLDESIAAMREEGIDAEGFVGDSDPEVAIEDALARFPADEVLISTHPKGRSNWLEKGVFERAREELEQPVTHIVVDLEGEEAEVVEVESAPGGHPPGYEDDVAERPQLFSRMSGRDVAGILMAILGTVALGVLAVLCAGGSDEPIGSGCAIRLLIAMAAFVISVWHVVALVFFETIRYRGPWAKIASSLILFGMPPAILVSLLVG